MRLFLSTFIISMLIFWQVASANEIIPYRFGDKLHIISGPFAGGIAVIIEESAFQNDCIGYRYYAKIVRKGLHKRDFVCHEQLQEMR